MRQHSGCTGRACLGEAPRGRAPRREARCLLGNGGAGVLQLGSGWAHRATKCAHFPIWLVRGGTGLFCSWKRPLARRVRSCIRQARAQPTRNPPWSWSCACGRLMIKFFGVPAPAISRFARPWCCLPCRRLPQLTSTTTSHQPPATSHKQAKRQATASCMASWRLGNCNDNDKYSLCPAIARSNGASIQVVRGLSIVASV